MMTCGKKIKLEIKSKSRSKIEIKVKTSGINCVHGKAIPKPPVRSILERKKIPKQADFYHSRFREGNYSSNNLTLMVSYCI